ncbi:hypothetical protein BKA70DRAFT_1219957 [Coprinopsis sp. MPI-PUGE-AT-0042]|nr:hypothetical protein BKA70DRAFT_1219957 [Coprinopsis sp. MPI-PUGE-AT-0042]
MEQPVSHILRTNAWGRELIITHTLIALRVAAAKAQASFQGHENVGDQAKAVHEAHELWTLVRALQDGEAPRFSTAEERIFYSVSKMIKAHAFPNPPPGRTLGGTGLLPWQLQFEAASLVSDTTLQAIGAEMGHPPTDIPTFIKIYRMAAKQKWYCLLSEEEIDILDQAHGFGGSDCGESPSA